jgi:hypothetical protein
MTGLVVNLEFFGLWEFFFNEMKFGVRSAWCPTVEPMLYWWH